MLPPRLDAARGEAVARLVAVQFECPGETFAAIADLGGALLAPGRRDLRQQCRDTLIDLLALGVDPNRTVCYCRSDVPQLAELLWIIGCSEAGALIGHPWQDDARFMATDVLGLRATLVAIGAEGDDAIAEIRSVAARFNQGFASEIFPLPTRAPDADGEPADADTLERFLHARGELAKDPAYLDDILRDGAARARDEVQQTIELARDAVGLGSPPASVVETWGVRGVNEASSE